MVSIEKVTIKSEKFAELRRLWCLVFGDEPDYVDDFYRNFGDDIIGYVLSDAAGVQSALTCFKMGVLAGAPCESDNGREVWVSYAICTDPGARGKGYGALITKCARDEVTACGGISVLSPAEASLVEFYKPLGYSANGLTAAADWKSFDSSDWKLISAKRYFELRSAMLEQFTHIEPGEQTRAWIDAEYGDYLEAIDRTAICIREAELLPEAVSGDDLVQGMTAGYAGNVYLGFAFN